MSKILWSISAMYRIRGAAAFTLQTRSSTSFLFAIKQNKAITKENKPTLLHRNHRSLASTRLFSGSSHDELQMENLYMEWSIEDDIYLFQNMNDSLPKLAAKLGRGLRGVESRIQKLKNVNSQAYKRLFVGDHGLSESENDSSQKLTPALEVMRRIKWDYTLDPADFSVDYFDRVDETIHTSPFGAPNESVKGKEEMFVFAIPEHRIMAIKYKEKVVWDKQKRIDKVFGSMNGKGETIDMVIETYDEWLQKEKEIEAYNKQRQVEMGTKIRSVLGDVLFMALKDISTNLQTKAKAGLMEPQDVDDYVQEAIVLFRRARAISTEEFSDMPQTDVEALDLFSSLVALLPDDDLREAILHKIYKQVISLDPSRRKGSSRGDDQLPELNEDELTETFVRGSGAGGQKINKTSNAVLLVHEPTQIKIQCQDTRSLQQNRKIARKRMKLKLDEYYNGSQSKTQKKIVKKVNKKQKAKSRNKARQRKKKEAQDQSNEMYE